MNRKIKIAVAALLGFSAACSSVKNAPKESTKPETENMTPIQVNDSIAPRMHVMYGVRTPLEQVESQPRESVSIPLKEEKK